MAIDLEVLYIDNDLVVEVNGLQEPTESAYQNSATVTCTIQDRSGTAVSGVSWPLTLSYVAASDGIYRGTVDSTASFVEGAQYEAVITAVSGTLDAKWTVPCIANTRRV